MVRQGSLPGSLKTDELESSIKASEELKSQTEAALKEAQAGRADAEVISEATAMREKEAASFKAEKAEYEANIADINKAVAAIESGNRRCRM